MTVFSLSVGGTEELRPYWQKYMYKALMLVFVVDSSSPQLFPLAKTYLHVLLASDPNLPLMVLANKQVSMTEKTLHTAFNKSQQASCPQRTAHSLKLASVCISCISVVREGAD